MDKKTKKKERQPPLFCDPHPAQPCGCTQKRRNRRLSHNFVSLRSILGPLSSFSFISDVMVRELVTKWMPPGRLKPNEWPSVFLIVCVIMYGHSWFNLYWRPDTEKVVTRAAGLSDSESNYWDSAARTLRSLIQWPQCNRSRFTAWPLAPWKGQGLNLFSFFFFS